MAHFHPKDQRLEPNKPEEAESERIQQRGRPHGRCLEACIVLPSLLPRFKVIATAHGQPYKVEKWGPIGRNLLRLTEYFFIFLPHIRTSVSLPFAKYCKKKYHKEVHYIPNGVDILPVFSRDKPDEPNQPDKPDQPNNQNI